MILVILRGVFILLAAVVTALYVLPFQANQELQFNNVLLIMVVAIGLATLIVAVDVFTPRKKLSAMSGVFLGLVGGLIAAYAFSFVIALVGLLTAPEVTVQPIQYTPAELHQLDEPVRQAALIQQREYEEQVKRRESYLNFLAGAKVLIGLVTCYLGISLVMQTKDDFRFVLPYVEFAKQIRGNRPTLLDTSVIIDGRILDIVKTQFLQGALIVPKFVLNELQTVADSADKIKRSRGRRGLDILQKLQSDPMVGVSVEESDVDGTTVDQKLLSLALQLQARVMTNDYNLAKIAVLRGVDVLNLNDLAAALKPVVLPGETMKVRILKPGEGATQGVGYLDDGTMVVVEYARSLVGHDVELTVTSMLQTTAGRMIFGKAVQEDSSHAHHAGYGEATSAGDEKEHKNGTEGHKLANREASDAINKSKANELGPQSKKENKDLSTEPPESDTSGQQHWGRNPRRGR